MTSIPDFPRSDFMRRALRLARRGAGRTAPNPAVGAVVVRRGRVVGEGYHRAAGLPHAEVEALLEAGSAARGADLYVTLEPCNHRGRTGPCTDAVLAAGVARVAYAMDDPNPAVAGGGARRLRDAGLVLHRGLSEAEARELNRGFCRWVVSGKPFVTLKLAVSLDGQIAAAGGNSRWITGESARRRVHRMRSEADAVLIGGETARRDDPSLTTRLPGGHDPRRVILTSRPRELAGGNLFRKKGGEVIVACRKDVPERDLRAVREAGGKVLRLPVRKGAVRAGDLLAALGAEGILSLLVEGGGPDRRVARGRGRRRPLRRLRRPPAPGGRGPRRVGMGRTCAVVRGAPRLHLGAPLRPGHRDHRGAPAAGVTAARRKIVV